MDRVAVVAALARIARKPAADIPDQAMLAGLGVSSSLGLSLLRSRLESASGRTLEPLSGNMRVGDLVTMLANGTEPRVPGVAQASAASQVGTALAATQGEALPANGRADGESLPWRGAIGLGLDIQDVESMPVTNDYRSHEFYRSHFAPGEIATALLRPDARLHLCGIFCAKEAAKKSHPLLLEMRMSDFVVTHAPDGKPLLTLSDDAALPCHFQFIISISHTPTFAAAACITTWSQRNA